MRHRLTFIVLLIVVLSAFTLHAQDEPDIVRAAIGSIQLGAANTLIADQEGYFVSQNIEIELIQTASSATATENLTLLIQGEIDVLQTNWTAGLFNSIIRGAEVRAVAIASINDPDHCPYFTYGVAAGQGENFEPESLRGTTIAIGAGVSEYFVDRWLSLYGMSVEDVTLESGLAAGARGEALANGAVTFAAFSEPQLTISQREYGIEIVVGTNEFAPNSSQAVLLFGPTFLNRDDDLAVRFLTAYLQGSRQFNEGATDRNIEIVSEGTGVDAEVLRAACWIKFSEDGQVNVEFMQDYINWLDERGLLDTVPDIETVYDPSYAEEAYARVLEIYPEPEATPGS